MQIIQLIDFNIDLTLLLYSLNGALKLKHMFVKHNFALTSYDLSKLFLLCCVSFSFPRKMDLKYPFCTVYHTFVLVAVSGSCQRRLKYNTVPFQNPEVTFSATRFHISPVLSKRKAFADIYSNNSLVRIDLTVKKLKHTPFISFCNKPVITWPLGCLANLSPSGAKCDELASAFLAM